MYVLGEAARLGIEDLFAVIVALSVVTVLEFYRGRRVNLDLIRKSINILEDVLKPVDKIYTLIGLYVGYHVAYKLREKYVPHVNVTLLLLPRYAALYMPIAKITMRFDKIYIQYNFAGSVKDEVHVIRSGAYRRSLRRIIRRYYTLQKEEVEIRGVRFICLYTCRDKLGIILSCMRKLEHLDDIMHVALVPETNSVYVYARFRLESLKQIVRLGLNLAQILTMQK